MNLKDVKAVFQNGWVNKLCDDLINEHVDDFKLQVLESLQDTVYKLVDVESPRFTVQREAYLFVSDIVDKATDEMYTEVFSYA